jgi:hypothetical protein
MVEDVVIVQSRECGAHDPFGNPFVILVLKAESRDGQSLFDSALDVEDVKKVYLRSLNITPGVYRVRFTAYNAAGEHVTSKVTDYVSAQLSRPGYAAIR